jgi:transcriptional regulator with XRE-family HTH domain
MILSKNVNLLMHIGLRIKIARISKGLKQEELAERINKTRPLVSRIEQTGKVSHYTLKKICEVLEIDINEIEAANFTETPESYGDQFYETINLKSRIKEMQDDNSQLRILIAAQADLIKKQKEFINKLSKS